MPDSTRCLAIDGGAALFPAGPPDWPPRDRAIRAALDAAWADGSWGRYDGPHTKTLRNSLCDDFGVNSVTLCASGTIAVEMALRGVGVRPGDAVILAAYDFPGNFRAIEMIGARPVLVDIDPNTWSLDAELLPAVMDGTTSLSSPIRAIVVSHLHGGLASMREIMAFARQHEICVVEDACQAVGATVEGRPAGTWGDAGVLSFGGSKLLSAGRGGAVLTNDTAISQRMRIFSERGNAAFPLSELQAIVLRPQLTKLPKCHAIRGQRAKALIEATEHLPGLRTFENHVPGSPAFYKLPWHYMPCSPGATDRQAFLSRVQAEGVSLGAGFRGFAGRSNRRCQKVGELQHAVAAANDTVLLHHPILIDSETTVLRVATALKKVLAG